MKKIIIVVLLLIFPMSVSALSAECAIVMDQDSKRVLYSKNLEKEKLIASTTKIMTAVIAIEYGDLDTLVTVGDEILKAYGSAIYIEVGEELTLKDLLYGLMLRSGNDAAIEIAYAVSGNMESFVHLMNEKAKELGMKNTIFYNDHGLEEESGVGNTSTVYDMALLMSYANTIEEFKEITGTKETTLRTNYKTYIWPNKNKLLKMYKYATGGKTGFTEKARRTLVTSATKDDKNLVVVTFNDGNDFNDHMNLYEDYFNSYELVEVVNKDTYKIEDDYYNGKLFVNKSFKMMAKEEEKDHISTNIFLNKVDDYNDGECVGYVEIKIDNEVLEKLSVYVRKNEEEKEKESFFKRFISFLKFWK